ncbi:MAG: hypothetical protein A2Z29_06695 [Chloroflexi bacterium RBG_16_56_11]|nr:MAG: hypothetical protein A2Z29_06695 [Chloroflexi bacterium RBG_16_56_11]
MAKKEFAHLMKTMVVQSPPKGLYPEPRVWMEGKDMEGFNAHFSYGFIKKPVTLHPLEGMLVHPYDECLVFEGTDTKSILNLGAEVSVELGEEREEHTFKDPSVILVPKGLPHGPVTVKKLDRTIVHYSIGLAAAYKATAIAKPSRAAKTKGSKYSHLIKKMVTAVDPRADSSGMGYSSVIGRDGVMRPAEFGVGPGNGDQIVWLYGKDLEGFDVNFTWGFYSRCGKWHRGGEAHTHPEAEILCFLSLDPDHLEALGAELELGMGKDYERHIFNKPTVAICPAGFPHLPLITRWCDKPYGFIVVCLSGEHASPWVEA